ncbi:PREDICTED: MOR1 [Prunus dulcis]|uniref:PREDICTED: MOR1 n=1 Tax=Prunus dulcis TaxID=3755 RepID=A0A5E4FLC9_PRUDU|nr:PREDICTED: MOR1 [Prunus dulcis]
MSGTFDAITERMKSAQLAIATGYPEQYTRLLMHVNDNVNKGVSSRSPRASENPLQSGGGGGDGGGQGGRGGGGRRRGGRGGDEGECGDGDGGGDEDGWRWSSLLLLKAALKSNLNACF